MKIILQLVNNNLQKREEHIVSLGQYYSFGRSSGVDCVIDDGKMSGKHCRFLLKEDRLEIYDLNSKNGTYLNGIRIDQSEVFIGDEVRLGDTFLSLLGPKLSPEATEMLTFPGPFKERVQYELKADFTGAREKNQAYARKHPGEKSSVHSNQEIELRKRARTKIRLSKDEIRSKSPVLSTLAFVIDLVILLTMIILPVIFINRAGKQGLFGIGPEHFTSTKVLYIGVLEVLVIGLYLASQKYLKYSIGEKISGIEDLHQKQ